MAHVASQAQQQLEMKLCSRVYCCLLGCLVALLQPPESCVAAAAARLLSMCCAVTCTASLAFACYPLLLGCSAQTACTVCCCCCCQVAEHVLRGHLYRQPGETSETAPTEPGIMDLMAGGRHMTIMSQM
jgi:hypothetical protein